MTGWKKRWSSIAPYAIPAFAFFAIVMAVFWRLWTGIDGARRAFSWDALWEYWGDLQFPIDALRHGELPLWNPFDRAGYPFHADPQAGVLYPPNWLLWGLGALVGARWWLVAVKIVMHFWLGGVGMYAFLRRRRLPIACCYAGGVFFLLTYPFSHAMFSALNWGMAWTPWVLLALDVWAESPSRGKGATIALALGACQLTGAPGAFWYMLCLAAPYGVWAIWHHARAAADRREYLAAALGTLAISAALFAMIVAAQLLATSTLIGHTVRDQRDLDFVGSTAFYADDLFGMLVPRLPGEGAYVTFVMLFAVATRLTVRPTVRSLVLGGIAVFGVLCALGSTGSFLPFSASVLPPFGFFRRAHRYLFVSMAALSVLGAEGLALLATVEGDELRRRIGRMVLYAAALGVVIFGCGFVVYARTDKPEALRDPFALAFASIIVSAWAVHHLIAGEERNRRLFRGIAVVVMALDLWFARHPAIERNFWPVPVTAHDADAKLAEDRLYDREHLKYRPGIRLGIRDLGGYEGDPLALRRFAALLEAAKGDPRLLGHANVRYLMEGPRSTTKPTTLQTNALKSVAPEIFEVSEMAPAVLWVDTARVVKDQGEALATLKSVRPGSIAVLERSTLTPDELSRAEKDSGAPPTAGRMLEMQRNRLVAEIDAPADGIVVIHEAYYPGWQATVDGVATAITPANELFRGVFVGPGKHRIEMRYEARGYLTLAPLSILGWLVALALLWRERR